LIDIEPATLFGEMFTRHLKIANLWEGTVPFPSALYLKVGERAAQATYQAISSPGVRHIWGFGGKMSVIELLEILAPILRDHPDLRNLPYGLLIAKLLPLVGRLKHFVKPDVDLVEAARIPDSQDLNGDGSVTDLIPDFNNPTAFPTVNAVASQDLTLETKVAIPALPKYRNQFSAGVVVIGGASAAGRGFVPLGASAALDAPNPSDSPDGHIDADPTATGNQGTLSLKMAPLHDGLEGSNFTIAALAIPLQFPADVSVPVSSVLYQADRIEATTSFGVSSFLGFPETASYDLGTRTFRLGTAVPGATFYRAEFKDGAGQWWVYFKAMPAAIGFQLLAVPAGAVQRDSTVCPGNAGGPTRSCTSLRVTSISTKAAATGALAPTLDDLTAFGRMNLSRLDEVVDSFSRMGCKPNGSCAAASGP
jgi:hypothetical protein